MLTFNRLQVCAVSLAALAGTSCAFAQFTETEDNNNKLQANAVPGMISGQFITGTSTGSSTTAVGNNTADNFLISTAPATLGIYRHRVQVTSDTLGNGATLRGLTQSAGVINFASDGTLQTASATTDPARFVQWYGFGRQEQMYVRVTGTTSTTAEYTATLSTEPVTAIDAGTFTAGTLTIGRAPGVTTDTDLWVYDATFNPVPDGGIDDPESLTRTFSAGTYYIAYAPTNLANDQPASSDDTFRTGVVTDFPNAVAASSNATITSMNLRITDALGPIDVPVTRSAFEVVWVRMVVVDSGIASGRCCLPDGSCAVLRSASCDVLAGTYGGDATTCENAQCPQPGACCFSADFSCQILSQAQCTTAGGTYLGNGSSCGSCTPPPAGSVLVLGADTAANINDVTSKLQGTGLFPVVISKSVQGTTTPVPTLQYISQFDALITWTNNDYTDAIAMGNTLADYVDAGGGVVLPMFVISTTATDRQLGGRWDDSYQIVPAGGGNTNTSAGVGIGTPDNPNHPILAGVTSFLGGTSDFRPTSTALISHGQRIAPWVDGKTLVAVSTTRPNRVDLGMVPYSTGSSSAGWDQATDGARLMANALLYTMGPTGPTCGTSDFNGDGDFGTDQDIEAFFACLAGTCCPTCWQGGSDFNGDGDFGTDQDIEAFFRVLAGSPC
jgi:hypothetical protein